MEEEEDEKRKKVKSTQWAFKMAGNVIFFMFIVRRDIVHGNNHSLVNRVLSFHRRTCITDVSVIQPVNGQMLVTAGSASHFSSKCRGFYRL